MTLRRVAAAAALSAIVLAPLAGAPALAAGPDRTAAAAPDGTYHPLDSVRLLDTRDGTGAAYPAAVPPGGTIAVQVAGRGGVPSTGVSAVVLNVTATWGSSDTWITAWPSGTAKPATSNLNLASAGDERANLVTVAPGADGKVLLNNAKGSVHLIADVVGYYANGSGSTGGAYHPGTPTRTYDAREADEVWYPGETWPVPVGTEDMDDRVSAVVVNVTAISDGKGFLTLFGAGPRPNASTVNYAWNQVTPNLAVVPVVVGDDGEPYVHVYASGGTTEVLIDVLGWFDDSAGVDGHTFTAVAPVRALDTRTGAGPVAAGTSAAVPTTAVAPGAVAVVANVTGVSASAGTWLGVSAVPGKPDSSTLNLVAGETRPNLTVAPVAGNGFHVYNATGRTHVVADVFGYFH